MKKGFVFVETMMVLIVVLVSLFAIYKSYSVVTRNLKRKETYDNVNEIYKLNTLKNIFNSYDISDYYIYIDSDNCNLYMNSDCSEIMTTMNVNYLLLTNNNFENILDNKGNLSNSLVQYIGSIEDGHKTLILSSQNHGQEYFSSLKLEGYSCIEGYTLINTGTYRDYCSKSLDCSQGTVTGSTCTSTNPEVLTTESGYCCGSTCKSYSWTCSGGNPYPAIEDTTYSCSGIWNQSSDETRCFTSIICATQYEYSSERNTCVKYSTNTVLSYTGPNATSQCRDNCQYTCKQTDTNGYNCDCVKRTIISTSTPTCPTGSTPGDLSPQYCFKSATESTTYSCNPGDTISGETCTTSSTEATLKTIKSCATGWTLSGSVCIKSMTCEYGELDNGVCYTVDPAVRIN